MTNLIQFETCFNINSYQNENDKRFLFIIVHQFTTHISNIQDIVVKIGQMDIFFNDKKTPVMLSKQLRTMIETIGQTKNKQQQDIIIKKEIASLREQIANGLEADQYPDTLVKLIYFETMGYDSSFAHILPINLCQSSNIYIKKMAYLLAAMLLKSGQGVGVLMHNTLMKDLQSQNLYIKMIGLTTLRYFLTKELASQVLPLLLKLRKHDINMIRRKSLLVLLVIHLKHPQLLSDLKPLIQDAFNDPEAPVIFAGISLMSVAVKQDPLKLKDMTKKLVQILYKIVDHKYPHQYDYHKIPAPWAQIDILKMFQILGKNDQIISNQMVDVLERVLRRACNFQMHFNKSIIQQCVKTISNIYPHKYLIQQSEQSLGRFFEGGNNNMKYFGIVAMTELTKVRKQIVQKWQFVILECMDSPDITLAERTLTMLVKIANEDNTAIILDRLIRLTQKSTDDKERTSLIEKALTLIEKFSEDRQIFLRRMNEIFYKFESLISEQTVTNFLKVLLEISQLDDNFAEMAVSTYTQILLHFRNSTLVKVSAWAVAEFTLHLYNKNKNIQIVDQAVGALLNCAEEYIEDRNITFILCTNVAKLATITNKKQQVKQYWKKVAGRQDFFISSIGAQMIKMVKYSKAFFNSNDLVFDRNMGFLSQWADKYVKAPGKKTFLISKAKVTGKRVSYDIFDSENGQQEQKKQIQKKYEFKFNPGSRWGAPTVNKSVTTSVPQQQYQVLDQNKQQKKKQLTLRGPHQQKKAKNAVDQKKLKLAKSLFGPKKK